MTFLPYALAAASSVVGTLQSYRSAQAQAQTARFSAQVAERQAQLERQRGEADALEFERRQQKNIAASRALLAGAGVAATGTPLLAEGVSLEDMAFGAENLRRSAEDRAWAQEQDASLSRYRVANARQQGALSVGTSLLNSASKLSFFK